MTNSPEPMIIQGGMGVAVSGWKLARAVSETGQLGVVSGTAVDVTLARRLQDGDSGGHLRRAMSEFPFQEMCQRILDRYFVEGGKAKGQPYLSCPMPSAEPSQQQLELIVVANFVEVYLAKEGHNGLIGINYLEKIQVPTLPSLYGAMLAGVDYVLMGAGIPRAIPGILDRLSQGEPVELDLNVIGASKEDDFVLRFDPAAFADGAVPFLHRPKFLAIVSSATLATMLTKRASGYVDGFVIEGPTAGGHNAPPRGKMQLNDQGEPIYSDRDEPELEKFRDLGRPFWLAGSYGTPERLVEAIDAGAVGVQVGTAFAFCEESGLLPEIKRETLELIRAKNTQVKTDPQASPTGFPFKVLNLQNSMSECEVYNQRERRCDLGFLRTAYKKPDGTLGWRCPGEKVEHYVHKGGDEAETVGRKCICNGLVANVGMAQIRANGEQEPTIVTSGDDVGKIVRFLPTPEAESYSAKDVIAHLLTEVNATNPVLS